LLGWQSETMLYFNFGEPQPTPRTLKMKSSRLLLAVTTLAFTFLFTVAVSTTTAGTTGNGWSQTPTVDLRYLITSVDAATGTIQVEFMRDKTFQTYKTNPNTKINVNGNLGPFDRIKVGMQVRKYFIREGQTLAAIVVDRADLSPAQPPPPTNK
jgi:hypothetical protein